MKFESREDRMKAQMILKNNGFYFGKVDGVWGDKSKEAYANYLATRPAQTLVLEPPVAKTWWTSRAILGGLGSMISIIAGLFAINIDAASLTEVLILFAGAISAAISLWGSMERKGPIDTNRIAGNLKWSTFAGDK